METLHCHASSNSILSLSSNIGYELFENVDRESLWNDVHGSPIQPGSSPSNFNYGSSSQLDFEGLDLPSSDFSEIVPMANQFIALEQVTPIEQLRIIAQPKAMYRERYSSETNGTRDGASRFIRAEGNHPEGLRYPTIEIPAIWRNSNRKLYICVTLVTVPNAKARVVCIHPYGIDTKEVGVFKYPENSTQSENENRHYYQWLFCPVSNVELNNGRKSFQIIRKKMLQEHLKKYGPLQIYDSGCKDIGRVNNTSNSKKVIDIYQLQRSKLVFTLVEYMPNNTLQPIPSTSVMSQIMCDEKIEEKKSGVRYAPVEGKWNGGDEALMFIPKLDRDEAWNLYFNYGQQGGSQNIASVSVDMKTISFQTPPCPLLTQDRNADISIIVVQSEATIALVSFRYLAHKKN